MNTNQKLDVLIQDLEDAQSKRAQHWDKYRLSQIKEKAVREFLIKQIEEEINFSRSFSFFVQCFFKYNSRKSLSVENKFFLLLDGYSEFLGDKYHLKTDNERIDFLVNKFSRNKIQKIAINSILKSLLIQKHKYKSNDCIEDFRKFIKEERADLKGKKLFVQSIDSQAYKKFLLEKEDSKKKEKNVNKVNTIKREFILKKSKNLKVAVILDEFSFHCFKDEFEAIIITPDNWRDKFEKELPDLFFCESAWSGSDSKLRPWKGKIYSSINWKHENRTELLNILRYCKNAGIPTIFWNKEDPSHYTDQVHNFVGTAAMFDHVFTTAEECVESYKKDYSVKNVYSLPFATSPQMFNPIDLGERKNKIIFAGSWYANHIQRSKDMELIFDTILETHELKIVDRYYGSDDELHIYPEKYQNYIYPGIPFTEMPNLYKESNIALTFNTVKESKTMFARRAFELMSSNTLVVSNSSKGMEFLLDDLFIDIEKNPTALITADHKEFDQIKEKALDYVLHNHTYRHRWNYILDKINYQTIPDENTATVVALVESEFEIEKILDKIKLEGQSIKVLFILNTSINVNNIQQYFYKYSSQNISLVSLHYLEKYGKEKNIFETTHFFFIDNEFNSILSATTKLLDHSYYTGDSYVGFDDVYKYKLKDGFVVKNIFSKVDRFDSILNHLNNYVDEKVYYLDTYGLEIN